MFTFNYDSGASAISVWLVWIVVFALLFALNEVTRRSTIAGFFCFIVMPHIQTGSILQRFIHRQQAVLVSGVSVIYMEQARRRERNGVFPRIVSHFAFHH
jgi:hypothetical protein